MKVMLETSQYVPVIARMAQETFVENSGRYYTQKNLDSGERVYFLCNDTDPDALNPIGFCQTRRKTPRQVIPELSVEYPEPCWEIRRCYVLKGNQGKNAGSFMLETVVSKVKEAGAKTVYLFVLNENVRRAKVLSKAWL
ncbi:hypothetical protein HDU81_006137 [Chytriomyces hyalinus]|nr:hypothetical protein HDU81_006137 [Chytriomyces hyalinus]